MASMSKERDWVDYANLASNLVQNVQLGGIQDRLSGLQDLAAAQATEARAARRAIEKAGQKAERIANYREVVLQGEKALAGLRHHLPEKPLAVMALALAYRHGYRENGLRTDCFESFEDKDRLERLLNGLDEVGEAAAEKLTLEQQNDAKLSLQYRLEEADLKHVLDVQKHRELQAAEHANRARELEPEILELRKQIEALTPKVRDEAAAVQSSRKTLWFRIKECIAGCLGVLAALSAVTFLGAFAYQLLGNMSSDLSPSQLESTGHVVVWAALLFCISAGGAWWAGSACTETPKLTAREQLSALQSKLMMYEASAWMQPSPLSDEDKALYEKFGGSPETSSSTYERMLAERQALVASVLSDHSRQGQDKVGSGATTPPMKRLPRETGLEQDAVVLQSSNIKCPIGTTFQFDATVPGAADFPSLKQALDCFIGRPPRDYDEALDHLLLNGDSFVVVETPNMLRVFSKTPKIQVPDPAIHRYLFEGFGIPKEMKAVWQSSAKGASKPVRFADLFVNLDPQDC